MKRIVLKSSAVLASLALMFTAFNVNTACMLFVHQPKLPDNAKRLRSF
ncbi:cyclic lactone autoinducer peptide [Vallitaleaceae bacterium 9-2]